jgi:ATP-dependent DNA helicase RecG
MDAGVVTVLARVWTGARAADLEDVTLDFKTIGRSIGDALKDLAEAAMCFANAQGGTIVVGIQDGVGAGGLRGLPIGPDQNRQQGLRVD